MKKSYYDTDGGGRRYELVKSALAGGCPEMLKEMERIIKYIDSGDDSHLMGEAESQARQNDNLSKSLLELRAKKVELEKNLQEAKRLNQEIQDEIDKIVDKTEAYIKDNFLALEDYFGDYEAVSSPQGKVISEAIKDFHSVYVEIEGHVHKVEAIYKHRRKAIIQVTEKGYLLKDDSDGLDQRRSSQRIIEKGLDSLRSLRNLIWY